MFKCMDCGNCDKFLGTAYEKGDAIIEKDYLPENKSSQYSWIYIISDKNRKSDYRIKKCYYCNSENIKKI
ncbi:MAG TPA: hypothetical protein DCY00_04800 [Actinobacteria bacterium]|nr:hypothetical protein [Actinomycetota bacterium]